MTFLHRYKKWILVAAAGYNLMGGLLIIAFLTVKQPQEVLLRLIGSGPILLFVGGTAITFGTGYALSAIGKADERTFLLYGAGMKYWAFLLIAYAYLFDNLPFLGLAMGGLLNLLFALLFTALLVEGPKNS